MSLNGLDDAQVTGAYQGALAEGGGWFLLKYASRDAVEVLARGTGGAPEARGAVAQYDEKSPLYGFLLYRRRKVLIKYTPEGTSRLLQARVAVHFTAVSEKFPHDTTISIASADELSDAALASACSLHTAAPSSCSSSQSSRRKLDEITEDAEEGPVADIDTVSPASPERPTTAASSKATITGAPAPGAPSPSRTAREHPQYGLVEPPPLVQIKPVEIPKPTVVPKSTVPLQTVETVLEKDTPKDTSEPKTADFRDSLKAYDDIFQHGPAPRLSSQTARPAIADMYAEIYAQYNKPKVKLGPRPKVSLDAKRPHTSGPGSQAAARPVSSLPAGMRVANNRKTMEPKRPKSRDSSIVPSIAFPPPPPVPTVPELPALMSMQPPKSPASVRSMTLPSHTGQSQRSTAITPEKQRLMRALEMRRKQMQAQQEKQKEVIPEKVVIIRTSDVTEDVGSGDRQPVADPAVSKNQVEEEATTAKEESKGNAPTQAEEVASPTEQDVSPPAPTEGAHAVPEIRTEDPHIQIEDPAPKSTNSPLTVEDSGVDVTSSLPEPDDLQSAASASSPTTAQTQGSSCAPSTRPSSVSEDEHLLSEQLSKSNDFIEATLQELVGPTESHNGDEDDSVESTPTVVPESSTRVPSVEVASQDCTTEPLVGDRASDAAPAPLNWSKKRESMVLMPPNDDDAQSRRSKRESMVFSKPFESLSANEGLSKKEKRESMIFTAPKRQSFVEAKEKRRAAIDPVQIHISNEHSDGEYLSDDSFMDELQSATLHEAKPVSVSKSPITPYFPRKWSISEVSTPERSGSQPPKPGRFSPEQQSGRKVSGVWPPPTNTDTVGVAKKITVSSGISQRIKALAEKSNRDSIASVSSLATPDASASLVARRKSSFFSTPPSGNAPSGNFLNRLSRASFAKSPSETPPDRQSVKQPPPSREGPTVYNVKQTSEKPESVQVTARIIRDGAPLRPSLTMPNESTPLELQPSRITIDHQKSTQTSPSTYSPVKSSLYRVEPTSPRPPSSTHSKEQSNSAVPRSSTESSWRTFGRRLSESKGSAATRSLSTHSSESTEEKRDDRKEKKDSRTSKLFKRMSTISSMARKSQTNSSLQEEDTSLPSLREPPPAVQVGDLNVQFPDTLLWKRRWVELDAAGNLVLSLSRSEQSKGITKRYHLSEFRAPYAPDQDRQELPNSVVLDFVDGRTLQCACETYTAQVQVLQILREAHDAWIAYNQGQ